MLTSGITRIEISPSFALFALLAVFVGVAAGLHYIVATTLLARLFEETGRAIGVRVTGAPLAGLVASVAAAAVGARYGWRTAILRGGVVAVPGARVLPVRRTDRVAVAGPTDARSSRARVTRRAILATDDRLDDRAVGAGGRYLAGDAVVSLDVPRIIPRTLADDGFRPDFDLLFFIHDALQP